MRQTGGVSLPLVRSPRPWPRVAVPALGKSVCAGGRPSVLLLLRKTPARGWPQERPTAYPAFMSALVADLLLLGPHGDGIREPDERESWIDAEGRKCWYNPGEAYYYYREEDPPREEVSVPVSVPVDEMEAGEDDALGYDPMSPENLDDTWRALASDPEFGITGEPGPDPMANRLRLWMGLSPGDEFLPVHYENYVSVAAAATEAHPSAFSRLEAGREVLTVAM
ncbi:hypothetical protein C8R46DRAFT_1067657 [Mycena filopes]|nr:hypothetical protein C8R46DRAFT_1067657 [Mycena filopes]